jgi:hypothetical protein
MKNTSRRRFLLKEAERIFDDGIQKNPSDPYSYIGKLNLIRYHELGLERDAAKRSMITASALSMLEEAFEATHESAMIAGALADRRQDLGNPAEAIRTLTVALEAKPEDSRLRDLLIQYLTADGQHSPALKAALAGVKYDPNSWRLQRHVARLMRRNAYQLAPIKGAYEAALRHKKGDVSLLVEFSAFLFTNGFSDAAADIFEEGKKLRVFAHEKRQPRNWWVDDEGRRRIFSGKVRRISGGTAVAEAVPEGFEAFFWRTETWVAELRVGDPIQFQVGFNAFGPIAKVLLREA